MSVKLYDDIERTYSYMRDFSQNGEFTGSTVDAYRNATGTVSNYSKVFRYLSEMGCIEQLQRGGRDRLSVIRLLQPPTPEAYEQAYVSAPLTPKVSAAKLQEEMERRLPNVELVPLLESIEYRLTNLEARVDFLTPSEEE